MLQRGTSLKDALEMFFLDAEIKRLKPSTVNFYQVKLQNLVNYCQEQGIEHLEEITSTVLKQFTVSLIHRNLSSQYQHNILRAVRAFLNFCVTDNLLSSLPKITFPKLPKEIKKALSKDEIKIVLKACKTERDKLIVLLFLDTGIRASELIALNNEDIDIKSGLILIRKAKTNQRYVAIGANVKKRLLLYKKNKTALFIGKKGKRLTLSGIVQLFRRLRKKTGIQHLSAHALRRTMCIHSLRNGTPLAVLAKMLGHADISTLKYYLDITTEDIQEAHKQYGVVDNL